MRGILVTAFLICLVSTMPNANAEGEGPTPEDVTFVQGLLKRFGYDPGPIDGICGDLTANAVRAFHRDRKLPLDPGDIEPQAATVAGNLMTAFTDGVMRPTNSTPKVYQEALAGDAAAAVTVGQMYRRGDGTPVDYMLAYAWLSVAETNGHALAAMMKQDLVAGRKISDHEVTYADALADRICEGAKHRGGALSPADAVQHSKATM